LQLIDMAPMSEKAMVKAQAKAQAEAAKEAKRVEETNIIMASLYKAGISDDISPEQLEMQKTMEEGHTCACDCANTVKKSTFYANVGVCFVMCVVFMVFHLLTGKLHDRHCMLFTSANPGLVESIGAFAADINTLKADHTTEIVARGLNVDSSTFVADSVCTLTSGSTYPTPSKAFVTKNIGGVTVTDHVMVTSTAAQ
jgi:hypothetical protein